MAYILLEEVDSNLFSRTTRRVSIMDARTRYFNCMGDIYYECNYALLLFQKYSFQKRMIEMILAVLSSVSLAAWFFCNEWMLYYAGVIAATQIIGVMLPFLACAKREDAFRQAVFEIQPVQRQMEKNWFRIDREGLDDDEIEKMIEDLKLEEANAFNLLLHVGQQDDNKISIAAAERANANIQNTFGCGR